MLVTDHAQLGIVLMVESHLDDALAALVLRLLGATALVLDW